MKKLILIFLSSSLYGGELCTICLHNEGGTRQTSWFYTMHGPYAHRDCYEIILPCFRTLIEFNEKIIKVDKRKENYHLNECFKYNVYAVERCTNGFSLREYYQEFGERELRVLANTVGVEISKKYAKLVGNILPDEDL